MTETMSVRDAYASDVPAVEAVIRGIGLFTPEEADNFASSLPRHLAGGAEGRVWPLAGEGAGARKTGRLEPPVLRRAARGTPARRRPGGDCRSRAAPSRARSSHAAHRHLDRAAHGGGAGAL